MTAVTAKRAQAAKGHWLQENWLRVIVHVGVWGPLVWLIWRATHNDLGVDPVVTIQNVTGRTGMILLMLCLSATPLYIVFNFRPALKVRRALGLYAFMYAGLHFINFVALDYAFDIPFIFQDGIPQKPYILVGLSALILLLALAITSTKGWMKRLKKNWTRLHWLIYPIGILVIAHFLWQAKAAERYEPYYYASILTVLLLVRVPPIRQQIIKLRTRLTRGNAPSKRTPPKTERANVPATAQARKEIG